MAATNRPGWYARYVLDLFRSRHEALDHLAARPGEVHNLGAGYCRQYDLVSAQGPVLELVRLEPRSSRRWCRRQADGSVSALALNVHLANPAARLYMRSGFRIAGAGRGWFGVAMVRALGDDAHGKPVKIERVTGSTR
jgi:hypothetical protein